MPGRPPEYRGRFAPSPTGPLHLGSLIAALASYLDARANRGEWLLRMEDLDPPREEPGAAQRILDSLLQHGLQWDGELMWQSERSSAYESGLADLTAAGSLFKCDCTRAMLGANGACGGRCAPRQHTITSPASRRIEIAPGTQIAFVDGLQGPQVSLLGKEFADFVLLRKDGLTAYQLAVVIDDAAQGINQVVRGSDLLDSTPRQIYLQQQLGLPTPDYTHLPVITDSEGRKLSKQNHAPALRDDLAVANIRQALAFLQQPPPPAEVSEVSGLLSHAIANWHLSAVPHCLAIAGTGGTAGP